MGSIRRSRAILRAAWATLRRNPRLAWFPVLSGLGLLLTTAGSAAIVGFGSMLADEPEISTRAGSVAAMFFYVASQLITVGVGVAMTHAALEALAGREWSVRGSLAVARGKRGTIVSFAVIRATVGRLLASERTRKGKDGRKRRRRKRPSFFNKVARFAWWAATYLVLPVIARENRGGFGAIKRSAQLFRETWHETLVARFALGWFWVPAVVVIAAPVVLLAALGVREPAVLVPVVVLAGLVLAAFGLTLHTLDGIYRAALYTYASEGVVPEAFAGEELQEIWEVPGEGEVIDTTAVDAEED